MSSSTIPPIDDSTFNYDFFNYSIVFKYNLDVDVLKYYFYEIMYLSILKFKTESRDKTGGYFNIPFDDEGSYRLDFRKIDDDRKIKIRDDECSISELRQEMYEILYFNTSDECFINGESNSYCNSLYYKIKKWQVI